MARRWTSLRPHGCKRGDKVKVLGGNCYQGVVGIAQDDGQSNQRVGIEIDGSAVIQVKAERLVVLELGPGKQETPSNYPHPTSHNYRGHPNNQGVKARVKKAKKEEIKKAVAEAPPQPETTCCIHCEGSGLVVNPYSEKSMVCPKCNGEVTKVPGEKPIKENVMAEKQAERKKRSDWNFD